MVALFNKIKDTLFCTSRKAVDVVESKPKKGDLWDFSHSSLLIKDGARLVVGEKQVAALMNQGKLADIYYQGEHALTRLNMPILSVLKNWKSRKKSFDVGICFLSINPLNGFCWRTTNPILVRDSKYDSVLVEAYGKCDIKIDKDPSTFIETLINAEERDKQEEWLNDFIVSKFTNYLIKSKIDLLELSLESSDFSSELTLGLKEEFADHGIILEEFCLDKISLAKHDSSRVF